MLHLTWTKSGGDWGVVGVPWSLIPHELTVCLEKLRDYEATELEPETITNLKDNSEKRLTIGNSIDGYKVCLLSAAYGVGINLDDQHFPYIFFEHNGIKVLKKALFPKMKECLREFQKRALTL